MSDTTLPEACTDALARHMQPDLFKALCDPRRLALLGHLAVGGPQTVSGASGCCGVHISGVSRHLSILRRAGVVQALKRGREVHYQIDFEMLIGALRGLADALEDCRQRGGCC